MLARKEWWTAETLGQRLGMDVTEKESNVINGQLQKKMSVMFKRGEAEGHIGCSTAKSIFKSNKKQRLLQLV